MGFTGKAGSMSSYLTMEGWWLDDLMKSTIRENHRLSNDNKCDFTEATSRVVQGCSLCYPTIQTQRRRDKTSIYHK
jgi:hypothetical protein